MALKVKITCGEPTSYVAEGITGHKLYEDIEFRIETDSPSDVWHFLLKVDKNMILHATKVEITTMSDRLLEIMQKDKNIEDEKETTREFLGLKKK